MSQVSLPRTPKWKTKEDAKHTEGIDLGIRSDQRGIFRAFGLAATSHSVSSVFSVVPASEFEFAIVRLSDRYHYPPVTFFDSRRVMLTILRDGQAAQKLRARIEPARFPQTGWMRLFDGRRNFVHLG